MYVAPMQVAYLSIRESGTRHVGDLAYYSETDFQNLLGIVSNQKHNFFVNFHQWCELNLHVRDCWVL